MTVRRADRARKIATLQQEVRDSLTAQRRYVPGDYGLLSTVGRLVASGTLELDRQAAFSAGRQAFTRSMYEALLPVPWDRWIVEHCLDIPYPSSDSVPPRQAPLLVHERGPVIRGIKTISFRGLVPRQTPCTTDIVRKSRPLQLVEPRADLRSDSGRAARAGDAGLPIFPLRGDLLAIRCGLGISARALMDPSES